MTPKKENEIIELLKSGKFTIHYHDNGSCSLYSGIHKESLPKKSVAEFDMSESEGYLPPEVSLIVKALGGESGSE